MQVLAGALHLAQPFLLGRHPPQDTPDGLGGLFAVVGCRGLIQLWKDGEEGERKVLSDRAEAS